VQTLLNNIATIQTGIFAKPEPKGDVVYLHARHFNESGRLDSELFPDLKLNNKLEKHLLQPGDVLFASKGNRNFATWYEQHDPKAVASTTFFVIRLNSKSSSLILPAYLVWFLNHPQTQQQIKQFSRGSFIPSVPKSLLCDLEIVIPPIHTQQLILEIEKLYS